MENALPAGINHHAASEAVAKRTDANAAEAAQQQTAARPEGTKATATVELPVKSLRSSG